MKRMKLTFSQPVGNIIEKFQKMSSGGECLLGSGGCAYHNVRLVRGVKKKRMSVKDDKGGMRWLVRDVTSLVCPVAQQASAGRFGENDSVIDENDMQPSLSNDKAGTNKKLRIQHMDRDDQSGSHSQHTAMD